MFAGRGQQSLVLTLTADFRKVRHILFGSGYGAEVNIFKWINYPLLWVESHGHCNSNQQHQSLHVVVH